LGYRGIDKRIRWWSAKRFGKAFGPHRFRHALGSSAATEDPAAPGLGAAVLGITGVVYQEHYNRAKNAAAAARVHDVVRREREVVCADVADFPARAGPWRRGGHRPGRSRVGVTAP
jgi:hypothetical protein